MKSIFSKLWLSIISLVLFILIVIWVFQIILLNKFYINERANNLLKEGNDIISIITDSKDYKVANPKTIDEINSTISSFKEQVVVVDSKNNILFFNPQNTTYKKSYEGLISEILPQIKEEIKRGETFVHRRTSLRNSKYFIEVGIPIKENDNIIGYVILNSPLAPIKEATTILKNQLSIITLISLIIATFLSLLLAKLLINPILKITKTSKEIANGDFDARVELSSKDEIGELGNTLNNMAIQLSQIEKFRKEFIANTSHELKTPIALIRAYAELVLDIDAEKTTRDQHLQVIIDESNRLNTMVEDILHLSEMEAGYYTPHFAYFSVTDTIKSVINNFSLLSSEKNIHVTLEADNENTLIYADKDKLYQVFFNLINNSINHSHDSGNVLIKIKDANNAVRIEIKDNGAGIPKEDLPYVWDRFYKVDKSRKRNNTSTGLGMSIVKNILEAHKFQYGIESQLDQGTLVWIKIKK